MSAYIMYLRTLSNKELLTESNKILKCIEYIKVSYIKKELERRLRLEKSK